MGVNTMRRVDAEGIGYAIPSNIVQEFLNGTLDYKIAQIEAEEEREVANANRIPILNYLTKYWLAMYQKCYSYNLHRLYSEEITKSGFDYYIKRASSPPENYSTIGEWLSEMSGHIANKEFGVNLASAEKAIEKRMFDQ